MQTCGVTNTRPVKRRRFGIRIELSHDRSAVYSGESNGRLMIMANGPSHASNAGGGGCDDSVLARAMFALDNERPQDAEQIAAEVLRADPRHARALYILGCALTM